MSMNSNVKTMVNRLKDVVKDCQKDYERARDLYNKAGLDAGLKDSALQAMANAMQLKSVAIQNYANWKHILREDAKVNKE